MPTMVEQPRREALLSSASSHVHWPQAGDGTLLLQQVLDEARTTLSFPCQSRLHTLPLMLFFCIKFHFNKGCQVNSTKGSLTK